jgi:hypothetical protein
MITVNPLVKYLGIPAVRSLRTAAQLLQAIGVEMK